MVNRNGNPSLQAFASNDISVDAPLLRRASALRISVIIPVLNEAQNIASTISGIQQVLSTSPWSEAYQIIVADNGSTDDTRAIARAHGAQIVSVPVVGYGSACWEACRRTQGDVLLFLDGDGSPHPEDAVKILRQIEMGAQLVVGVRHNPETASMSRAQIFGNELACFLLRVLWRIPASDIGPFRAITRQAYERLHMRDRAFGWTVEMQVVAALKGMRVVEVPVRWRARAAGFSKVGGTLLGVWRAGWGILGKIAGLRIRHLFGSKYPLNYLSENRAEFLGAHTPSDSTLSQRKQL